MKFIAKLKKQAEQTNNREETKKDTENAAMKLTDDQLKMVAGGASFGLYNRIKKPE